jgi:hypothetical protein
MAMHAPSPQQKPERRPNSVAGFVWWFCRKLKQALRPSNPFRTATGVAVTGSESGSQSKAAQPAAGRAPAPATELITNPTVSQSRAAAPAPPGNSPSF